MLGTPYALIDLPAFLNDYARLAAVFARERGGDPGWSIYVKHFGNSVAQPALAAVGFGLLVVAVRGIQRETDRGRALMLLSFVAIYFFVMSRSFQIYARYLLPLLPLFSIACGVGLVSVVDWVRGRAATAWAPRLVGAALTLAILATPTVSAVQFSRGLAVQSTIGLAYAWIVSHVPEGSRVVVECGALRLPSTYPAAGVRLLVSRTIDDYRRDGVDYFLAAGPEFQQVLRDPGADPSLTNRYRALLASTEEVAAFDPGDGVTGPPIRVFRIVK